MLLDTFGVPSAEEAWSRLALYRSRDVLARRYLARHGLEINTGKANEIIAHLQQGEEYFRSAETAGVLTGPLEQYYGVLAFSRATILYLLPPYREASLSKKHGLSATITTDKGPIEDIRLVVQDGTFYELIRATDNAGSVSHLVFSLGENAILTNTNIRTSLRYKAMPAPKLESPFTLVDLAARIPDLRTTYEDAFATIAHCHLGGAQDILGSIQVTIRRWPKESPLPADIANRLGLESWNARLSEDGTEADFAKKIENGETFVSLAPNIVQSTAGHYQQTIIEPFPGGWALSPIASFFAASHALSSLVRYYPTRWARLVSGEKGDQLLPVLERLRSLIQSDFVRLLLTELERPALMDDRSPDQP
jgi:hypothetical protein